MRKTLISLFLSCAVAHADDDSFRELFADPATRTAALAELVPGTRDAYFHTALDHQLAGREEEYRKVMADWKAAADRKENPVSRDQWDVLENRQLLMDYEKNPVGSLTGLIRKLDLKFEDARPDAAAAAESLPTRVDAALVSEAAFEQAAVKEEPDAPYQKYQGERRYRELEQVESFDRDKTLWFLEYIGRADLPGIVPLVDRALGFDRSLSFTENALLRDLTKDQLDSLLTLHPDLRAKDSFALAYLKKLHPGEAVDLTLDTRAQAEHLRRCLDFVMTLPPTLNSLKAHVLFHYLMVQEELGNFPKAEFLAYLALPRMTPGMVKVQESRTEETVDFREDFFDATTWPPVRDDKEMVESLLLHFLG
ncbi:MAG: hypothetical protein EOP85_07725, partial [Verrucomicrobiaceae bacterium]